MTDLVAGVAMDFNLASPISKEVKFCLTSETDPTYFNDPSSSSPTNCPSLNETALGIVARIMRSNAKNNPYVNPTWIQFMRNLRLRKAASLLRV
jgi:hypothetical protein